MKALDILNEHNACSEAVSWVKHNSDKTDRELWELCERGDWLLWFCSRLNIDKKLLVLASCDCAELALPYVLEGEDRPRIAIETARAWCDGNATQKDVRAAYAAAKDAYNAYNAAASAAYDAAATDAYNAAANAAYAAAAAATAATAYVAAYTAYATAYSAAAYSATAYDARHKTLKRCANLVRKRIHWDVVDKCLEGE